MWLFKKPGIDWSFQNDAVKAILRDFRNDPRARILLVLPTGGGKTLTSVKALDQMLRDGTLGPHKRVLWVVHTLALAAHANDLLADDSTFQKFGFDRRLQKIVDVCMKAEGIKRLGNIKEYALIVIDEAHHAAAHSYFEFFEYPIGILGLTATPTRTDDKRLPFDKISYSISFRELVRRKVVLLPRFLPEVRTNISVDASSLDDPSQLEKFNSQERNTLVSQIILKEAAIHRLKKIVVFAATNAHVLRLCEELENQNDAAGKPFAHVGYIYGGDANDRRMNNDDYLRWHKQNKSSILVNCKLLNEGYDDPSIDTVVMAAPTNSILYYLQCIGRVVRNPSNAINARAHVVEIVDRLPNAAYRIDNRWLFAEISDFLEPDIRDIKQVRLLRGAAVVIRLLFDKTRPGDATSPCIWANLKDLSISEMIALGFGKRINLILFNDVPHSVAGRWRILALPDGDLEKVRFFNSWSDNIDSHYENNIEFIMSRDWRHLIDTPPLNGRPYRASFVGALHRASNHKRAKLPVDSLIYLSVR